MASTTKPKARRFKPPMPVTRQLLELETPSVYREIDNLMILSTTDLRDYVVKRSAKAEEARRQLESLVESLPLRERLAVAATAYKDVFIALELLNTTVLKHMADAIQPTHITATVEDVSVPTMPVFSESLFTE